MPTLAIFTYDSQVFTSDDFDGHLLKRDINPTTVAAIHNIAVNSYLMAYQADPENLVEHIVYGGSLKDTLTLNGAIGSRIKFDLGAGADSVIISKAFYGLLDTGADADSIVVKGGLFGGKVLTGDGNDSFTVSKGIVAGAEIDLGEGDDKFTSAISLWDSMLNLGNGNNTVTITGRFTAESEEEEDQETVNIQGGTGADKLTISGNVEAGIDLGLGKDVIVFAKDFSGGIKSASGGDIAADQVKIINIKGHSDADISTGIGSDIITIGKSYDGEMETVAGDDKVTIGGDVFGSMDLGDGNNMLTVKRDLVGHRLTDEPSTAVNFGIGNDTVLVGRHNLTGIDVGGGANKITISGDNRGWIVAGSGNDIITINGDSGDSTLDSVDVGNEGGVDLGDGDNTLLIKGDMFGGVEAGTGIDSVTINGDLTYQVRLDAGNDKLVIKGDMDEGHVSLGLGHDSLIISGDAEGNIEFGGGTDTFTVMGEADLGLNLYVSSGVTSTVVVTLGKGDDHIGMISVMQGKLNFGAGDDEFDIGNFDTLLPNAVVDFGAGIDSLNLLGTVTASDLHGAIGKLKNLEVLSIENGDEQTHTMNSADLIAISAAGATEFHLLVSGASTVEIDSMMHSSAEGELQIHSSGAFDIYIHFTSIEMPVI